jgi:NADH-quinone oxidoreductase subunit J
MTEAFYLAAVVAIAASIRAITTRNVMHGILYFIVSLLSVAIVFFLLGAPFAAALEIIIYAGAVMVLFVFALMLVGQHDPEAEARWISPRAFLGPAILSAVLLGELFYVLARAGTKPLAGEVTPETVGLSLFGPYLLVADLAGLLLLAGMVGAYHIGRRKDEEG